MGKLLMFVVFVALVVITVDGTSKCNKCKRKHCKPKRATSDSLKEDFFTCLGKCGGPCNRGNEQKALKFRRPWCIRCLDFEVPRVKLALPGPQPIDDDTLENACLKKSFCKRGKKYVAPKMDLVRNHICKNCIAHSCLLNLMSDCNTLCAATPCLDAAIAYGDAVTCVYNICIAPGAGPPLSMEQCLGDSGCGGPGGSCTGPNEWICYGFYWAFSAWNCMRQGGAAGCKPKPPVNEPFPVCLEKVKGGPGPSPCNPNPCQGPGMKEKCKMYYWGLKPPPPPNP